MYREIIFVTVAALQGSLVSYGFSLQAEKAASKGKAMRENSFQQKPFWICTQYQNDLLRRTLASPEDSIRESILTKEPARNCWYIFTLLVNWCWLACVLCLLVFRGISRWCLFPRYAYGDMDPPGARPSLHWAKSGCDPPSSTHSAPCSSSGTGTG